MSLDNSNELDDVVLESRDCREFRHVEASSADECTVDVRLAHEACDVAALDRTAVKNAGAVGDVVTD